MKITDAFLGEHGALYAWFDVVTETLATGPGAGVVASTAERMAEVLGSHARLENELLLDPVAAEGGEEGPLAVMRREHDEIEELLEEARDPDDPVRAADLLREAVAVAREHFEKEERAAFPMAERVLDAGELEALGARWAERRGVRLEDRSG